MSTCSICMCRDCQQLHGRKILFTSLHFKSIHKRMVRLGFLPCQLAGIHLTNLLKICGSEAGIAGKTNHSLRATDATRLYTSGVSERAIQGRTRHKSMEALHTYERISAEQEKEICHVLGNVTNRSSHHSRAVTSLPVPLLDICQTQTMPQSSTFNISGCTVNIYNGPVVQSSSGKYSISVK